MLTATFLEILIGFCSDLSYELFMVESKFLLQR